MSRDPRLGSHVTPLGPPQRREEGLSWSSREDGKAEHGWGGEARCPLARGGAVTQATPRDRRTPSTQAGRGGWGEGGPHAGLAPRGPVHLATAGNTGLSHLCPRHPRPGSHPSQPWQAGALAPHGALAWHCGHPPALPAGPPLLCRPQPFTSGAGGSRLIDRSLRRRGLVLACGTAERTCRCG